MRKVEPALRELIEQPVPFAASGAVARRVQKRSGMDDRELTDALHGLDYPAPRNKLIAKAVENGAPGEVIRRIRELPETSDYMDPDQLRAALGVDVPETKPDGGWE